MTPCPRHPLTPLTSLGCCQCHGEELAGLENAKKPFSLPGRKRGRPKKNADLNFEDDVAGEEIEHDPEIQGDMLRSIKSWRDEATNEWGRWKNA